VLSQDGKAGLGVGLGLGIPSLIATSLGAYYGWRAAKKKRQREIERRSRSGLY
jgi:hypothetical protein